MFDDIRNNILKPFYLFIYRLSALLLLSGALTFIVGWGIVMLFFMFDRTWIAPTFLSSTSDKMLQFTAGYQQAFQNVETLKVAVSQAERDVIFTKKNAELLHALGDDTGRYYRAVDKLGKSKELDIRNSYAMNNDLDTVKDALNKSAQAGLLTKNDITQTLAGIQTFKNQTTDGGVTLNTTKIAAESQIVILYSQIAQADNDVHTKQETLEGARRSLEVAGRALSTLSHSAYYATQANLGSNLAFVAYNNRSVAKVGAPVYDCLLTIIICHQVGVIKTIYKDEQVIDFPLFNVKLSRTERGFLVDLDVSEQKSMDSTVMFINKPLWF